MTMPPVPLSEGVALIIWVIASPTIFWLSIICFKIAIDIWLLTSDVFMSEAITAILFCMAGTAEMFIKIVSAGRGKS